MSLIKYFMADLSEFRSSTPHILCGEKLQDVKSIQKSILKFGLLNPLVVAGNGNHLLVIDGRKRLAALRRLEFSGLLPRDLGKVPFIIVNEAKAAVNEVMEDPLPLLSNAEKYDRFAQLRAEGKDIAEIGETLYASGHFVRKMMSVSRLSETLQKAFFSGTLSLGQASAFAALPNPLDQDNLLHRLGPFVSPADIRAAIEDNWSALRKPAGNIIKMPHDSKLVRQAAA